MAIVIETSADKARAWLYSGLVHALCIALMFTSLWWTRKSVVITPPGPVIEAVLIGPAQAPKPRATKPRKADQLPKPTPPKEEPKPQEPTEPVKPDTKEQERIAALATEKAEAEKKEQDERQRKQQVLLEEQKKQEADKQKKLEEEKKQQQKDKQAKELADKQKKLDQQHLQEVMEAEEAKTGAEGKDDSLLSQYSAALLNAAFQNWMRPDTTESVVCDVNIKQIPGGEVLSANVMEPCRTDALTKQSIEAAILRAQPLPYKGFESVFRREIIFTFCFPKEACPK